MAKTIYGQAEIEAWTRLLGDHRPRTIEEIEWPTFPQIEAFTPMPISHSIAFRMAARDGSGIEFIINPVAARHLAACILTMGMEAGWLDEQANVICPPLPSFDA
jgi:hypothetical protein